MNYSHFQLMQNLILESEQTGLLMSPKGLSGFSGDMLVGMLQRLAKYQESINGGDYLEIGVFQGLTLLSTASAASGIAAYGIDNFAQYDTDGKNRAILSARIRENGITNAYLIDQDYEDALENLDAHIGNRKIGLLFVDGPHDYRSQLTCLQLARKHLGESAVIVVDDCNYRHVRQANRDFLLWNPNFKLVCEAYTECHPMNMSQTQESSARQGWWNGVNILARDPDDLLEPMLPSTYRPRTLYENENTTHAANMRPLRPKQPCWFRRFSSCD